jgi:hypothetical protein
MEVLKGRIRGPKRKLRKKLTRRDRDWRIMIAEGKRNSVGIWGTIGLASPVDG